MKIGVVFPQTEIGSDPAAAAAYATTAESLGYSHLLAYDHVLGANTASRPDWQGPYTMNSMFQEPLVLFSYLAGLTKSIELVTGVIILPQRQTVLVAKQAACVDVLSGGRLRLGVGTGWNEIEYEALGENFKNRGRRSEEQIDLLRRLWKDEAISFDGEWHKVTDAGLNPLPAKRHIPIWLGGLAPAVIDRVGRIADGWFPKSQPGEAPTDEVRSDVANIHESAIAAGRDPSAIGVEPRIRLSEIPRNQWSAVTGAWRAAGATHLSVITMDAGLDVDAQIEQLRDYAETVGLS